MKNEFTIKQAIEIQEEQLKRWEKVLKPEIAAKLRKLVTAENDKTKDPYEICRGTDIDVFVHNPDYYFR